MHRVRHGVLSIVTLVTCAACGADDGNTKKESTGTPSAVSPGWQELIGGDWALSPGAEQYYCVRLTLDHDVVVGGFQPLGPLGTHHTTLSVSSPTMPDGVTECDGAVGLTNSKGLWGSGVNTPPVEFPTGVGMIIRSGQQLLLNLHLFNTTTAPLTGHSGMAFLARSATELVNEADGTLMGPIAIDLPPREARTVSGACTFAQEETIFAIMPHMHTLGRHMKVTAQRAGQQDFVMHDGNFDFQEQLAMPVQPLTLAAGDRIRVACSYQNDTDRQVTFGESTTDEMCLVAVARYPVSNQPACIQ